MANFGGLHKALASKSQLDIQHGILQLLRTFWDPFVGCRIEF
jgi:hypothetical protein